MLRRKITDQLLAWKNTPGRKPLIIKGCRQCGKTFSVLEFARKNYKHTVYLNFFENPDYASVFSGSLEIDNIVMMLSALLGKDAVFEPGQTILILDEIQDCPEARTALKFFRIDGRYDVIGTGSLLGVKGYGKEPRSVPVGSETVLEMYPLDFEEFLWANDIAEPVIALLQRSLDSGSPVPEALHNRMRQLLLQYTVVGGMPDAVQTFVTSRQMDEVLRIQQDIVRSYEDDMVKYAEKKDKSRIKECFQSIPRQLAKENKKFQYSVVKKAPPPQNMPEACNGSRTLASSHGATICPLPSCLWMGMRKRIPLRSICATPACSSACWRMERSLTSCKATSMATKALSLKT